MLFGSQRSTKYKVIISTLLILSVLILVFQLKTINPRLLTYGDYIQYWAAGRLMNSGHNPYDIEKVVELKAIEGKEEIAEKHSAHMLYPPWIFPLLIATSFKSYGISRIIWLLIHIVIVFLSSKLLWKIYGGDKNYELMSYLIIFTFTPTIYVLGYGHITTLNLFGIILFLFFVHPRTKNHNYDYLAGFCLALSFYKPHLLIIFYFIVFFWVLQQRRWRIFVGSFLFLFLNSLIAIVIKPDIFVLFMNSIIQYPKGVWATPTLGMLLRLLFGFNREWLQLLPTLIGTAIAFVFWFYKRNRWDWVDSAPFLFLISIIFSPFMWVYDMVLLVLPVLFIFTQYIDLKSTLWKITFTTSFLVINITAFYIHLSNYDYVLFWLPPVIFTWFLFWNTYYFRMTGEKLFVAVD